MLDRFNIAELQQSTVIPDRHALPGNQMLIEAPLGDWLRESLEVATQEDADEKLLLIAAVYLWRNMGKLSWKKGFAMARENIAWMAFARDVSKGGAFTAKTGPDEGHDAHTKILWRIENTTARDAALHWYGAKIVIHDQPEGDGPRSRMDAVSARIARKGGRRAAQPEPPKEQPNLF